jgi:hypothetical protein
MAISGLSEGRWAGSLGRQVQGGRRPYKAILNALSAQIAQSQCLA